jgi:hypothetical protein
MRALNVSLPSNLAGFKLCSLSNSSRQSLNVSHLVANICSSTADVSGLLLHISRASIAGAIAGLMLIATTVCSRTTNMCGAVWDQLAGALIADSLSTRAAGCRVQEGALVIGAAVSGISRLSAIATRRSDSDIGACGEVNVIVANAGDAVGAATRGTTAAVGTSTTTINIACKFAVMDLDIDDGGSVRDGVNCGLDGVTLVVTIGTADAANTVAL